jgi:hypothetical protein
MRTIIHEMDYENPIGAGKLLYESEGSPTGVLETWRFTSALDGYFFIRVDLDARESSGRDSCLFHLLVNPNMKIERLKYRYLSAPTDIAGDVQFDDQNIRMSREITDNRSKRKRIELDELPFHPNTEFWFPSVMGIGVMASNAVGRNTCDFVSLDEKQEYIFRRGSAQFSWEEEARLVSTNQEVTVRCCSIEWNGRQSKVWLDKYNWPVKASIPGDVSVLETAYVRYKINADSHLPPADNPVKRN